MKTFLLKTESGIALEIDGVVSDCALDLTDVLDKCATIFGMALLFYCKTEKDKILDSVFPDNNTQINSSYRLGHITGFNAAVSICNYLNSEKQFTREDMITSWNEGIKSIVNNVTNHLYEESDVVLSCKDFISSLRPNRVECTVEMEIVNNTIRVLSLKTE